LPDTALAAAEKSYMVRVPAAGIHAQVIGPNERLKIWMRRAPWFFVPLRENGVSRIYSRLRLITDTERPIEDALPPEFASMARHPSSELDGSVSNAVLWFFEDAVFKDIWRRISRRDCSVLLTCW